MWAMGKRGAAAPAPKSSPPAKQKKANGGAADKGETGEEHPTVALLKGALDILKDELASVAECDPVDAAGIGAFDLASYKRNMKKHNEYECCVVLTDMNALSFTHTSIPPGMGERLSPCVPCSPQ